MAPTRLPIARIAALYLPLLLAFTKGGWFISAFSQSLRCAGFLNTKSRESLRAEVAATLAANLAHSPSFAVGRAATSSKTMIIHAMSGGDGAGEGGEDAAASKATGEDSTPNKKKNRKKKKKFVVKSDLADEAVSSDGILEGKAEERLRREEAAARSNLGVTSRRKMKDSAMVPQSSRGGGGRRMSGKAAKIQRQRTAGGSVDSSTETIIASPPEDQKVQVQAAKRGNKTVTIVRGLASPMEDRKKLLKEMKSKLGGGGTLVDGILELQGSHAEKILAYLKSKGFSRAKVVGK